MEAALVTILLLNPLRTASVARADVQALVNEVFAAIHRGDAATDDAQKLATYRGAVAQAEDAVRLDENSADAHYALFCSLGRVAQMRNPLTQALMLPRLRRELDRVLTLRPQDNDALAAKAEMLLRLPRLMGGNVAAAEDYARRSIRSDPTCWQAYIVLAQALIAENRPAAARHELTRMLAVIDPQRRECAEARRLLAEIGPVS